MRRLVTWTVVLLGLGVGAGCDERENIRETAPPVGEREVAADGELVEEDAMRGLRQQTEQLARQTGETAESAEQAAEQEAAELGERVEAEAPEVRQRAESLGEELRQGAGEAAREIRESGEALGRRLSGDEVEGVVADVREDRLLLRGPEGNPLVLRTDERTQVVQDGQPILQENIQPGSEVRASYILEGEERVARRVEVEAPAAR